MKKIVISLVVAVFCLGIPQSRAMNENLDLKQEQVPFWNQKTVEGVGYLALGGLVNAIVTGPEVVEAFLDDGVPLGILASVVLPVFPFAVVLDCCVGYFYNGHHFEHYQRFSSQYSTSAMTKAALLETGAFVACYKGIRLASEGLSEWWYSPKEKVG